RTQRKTKHRYFWFCFPWRPLLPSRFKIEHWLNGVGMRAVVVREFGPLKQLKIEEFPVPTPAPNEVLIDVRAAGVNFPDILVIGGKYQILPQRPFVPGKEAAGVVVAVGAQVTTVKP